MNRLYPNSRRESSNENQYLNTLPAGEDGGRSAARRKRDKKTFSPSRREIASDIPFTLTMSGVSYPNGDGDGDRFNSCQVIYSQFGFAIHQNDHQAKRRFVEWAQNEMAVVPDFHKRILFSDEAHFWLKSYVNKQNCRIWSEANPQVYVETP
ncbi:hypothetical protein TNCV_4775311 [Trichonephila clavipes]|nr:hypothetical protein TNCV_4775311 [Trichonephila clavipes]